MLATAFVAYTIAAPGQLSLVPYLLLLLAVLGGRVLEHCRSWLVVLRPVH